MQEKKIRKYQQIAVVNKVAIRDDVISHIGEQVSEVASHFTEIDLQDNLLYKWSEVAYLTSQVCCFYTKYLHTKYFCFRQKSLC